MKTKTTFNKIFLLLAFLFFFYVVIGFFFVPMILKNFITEQVKTITGLNISLDTVSFNPLSFGIEVTGVQISDHKEQEFLTAKSISTNFEPSQLLFGQYNFSHVLLIDPKLTAKLDSNYNLIQPQLNIPPSKETPDKAIDLLVDEISILNASTNISSSALTQDIALNKLTFKLNHFNLSDLASEFKLNISTVQKEQILMNGHYNHSKQLLTSDFTLKGIQSSTISALFPPQFAMALTQGQIDTQGNINWPLALLPKINLDWVEWNNLSADWSEIAGIQEAFIRSELIAVNMNNQQIQAQDLFIKQGIFTINWPWYVDESQDETRDKIYDEPLTIQTEDGDSNNLWQFSIEQTTLKDIPITLSDKNLSAEITQTIDTATIQHLNNTNFSTTFSLRLTDNMPDNMAGSIELKGSLKNYDEPSLRTDIIIKDFNLKPLSPWLEDLSGFMLTQGKLNAQQHFSFHDSIWQSKGQLTLTDTQVINPNDKGSNSTEQAELIVLGRFDVIDSQISSKDKHIILNQITLDHAKGLLPLSQSTTTAEKITEAKKEDRAKVDKEWRVILGNINSDK